MTLLPSSQYNLSLSLLPLFSDFCMAYPPIIPHPTIPPAYCHSSQNPSPPELPTFYTTLLLASPAFSCSYLNSYGPHETPGYLLSFLSFS